MPFSIDADNLQGVPISPIPPEDGEALVYDSVAGEYIPTDVASVGGLVFQGNWDADTNTPDLVTSPPDAGKFWYVSVAGSTDLGGVTSWNIGDWAVSKGGGSWSKVDNTESVVSVNTKTGAVVLDPDDLDDAATTHKFASAAELADIATNTSKRHDQGTDLGLDTGGANPVTAATIKGHVDDVTGNPHAVTAAQAGAEPAFAKNGAFNKDFGAGAGDVCQGNDARLSNARTPKHSTQVLTFDATQDWDAAAGTMAALTLTADCTFDAPSNLEAGGEYVLILNTSTYDVTSWAAVFKWVGGNAPVLPASSKVVIFFLYDGTDLMGVMNGGFS